MKRVCGAMLVAGLGLVLCSCGVGVVMGDPPSIKSFVTDKAATISKDKAARSALNLLGRFEALDLACDASVLHFYAEDARMFMGAKQPDGSIVWTALDKNAYSTMVRQSYEASKSLAKNGYRNLNGSSTYGQPKVVVYGDGSVKIEVTTAIAGVGSGEMQWLMREYPAPNGWQIVYEKAIITPAAPQSNTQSVFQALKKIQ